MYVRMYDDLKRHEGDNPTIGILLCAETDEDIARYSVLYDNERLFMSKYLTYLPTKEQLKTEIEKQKNIFYAQHPQLRVINCQRYYEQDRAIYPFYLERK